MQVIGESAIDNNILFTDECSTEVAEWEECTGYIVSETDCTNLYGCCYDDSDISGDYCFEKNADGKSLYNHIITAITKISIFN